MLAAEGFWFIIVPMLLFLGAGFLGIWRKRPALLGLAAIALVIWVAMMFFFRDPARPQPPEYALLAPTDGMIDVLERLPDGRTRIGIFISLLDVHAIRSPATGSVARWQFIPGEFRNAMEPETAASNQRVTVNLGTQHGPVQFTVSTGAIARRVILPLELGQRVLAGERIGFVRFGSRSELILPYGVDVTVELDQQVTGGVTVVAVPREGPSVPDSLPSVLRERTALDTGRRP